MKKAIVTALLVSMLFVFVSAPVAAGGGQVRGALGQGAVSQVQVQDPPPFQP